MSSDSIDSAENGSPAASQGALDKPVDVRLWPAVVILAAEASAVFLPGLIVPGSVLAFLGMIFGPMVATLAFLIWWMAASRATWRFRGVVLVGFIVICVGSGLLMDPTMGIPLFMYGVPTATAAWVIVLAWTRGVPWGRRSACILLSILVAVSWVQLFRMEGTDGALRPDLVVRWQPLKEDAVLEALREFEESAPRVAEAEESAVSASAEADWPEFRGRDRTGKVFGVKIETNWEENAPVELWRRPVGPGWSSFAVVGDRLYTQEQRGGDEAVVCYNTVTGGEVWAHLDSTKFSEDMGGAGPRATPTIVGDKLYALGANGRLNCLEAATGQAIWSRDIAADTGAELPQWGFSSSPLVVDDLVVVYAGAADAGMVAYGRELGEPMWECPAGSRSYSSPHFAKLEGTDLILMMSNGGLSAADPAGGSRIWHYDWSSEDQARIVQPAVLEDGDLLVATGYGIGTHRVSPSKTADVWQLDTVWESRNLKPYFNDFVYHEGLIYGFDDKIMTCIDPETGSRVWKGGRYGYGQLVLLADQDVLLVLSERGDVALVEAKPDGFKELAKFHALDGKTWNHPVVAQGKLFVRNAEEAVCYKLPLIAWPGAEMLAPEEE